LLRHSPKRILLGKVGRRLLLSLSNCLLQTLALRDSPNGSFYNCGHQVRPAASALLDAVARIALAAFSAAAVQPEQKENCENSHFTNNNKLPVAASDNTQPPDL
jgi:hypothetical protein